MSINLNILLLRNKIKLSEFCKEMNLKIYESLVAHCGQREIIPCSFDFWVSQCETKEVHTQVKEKAKTPTTKSLHNAKTKITKSKAPSKRAVPKASTSQKKK